MILNRYDVYDSYFADHATGRQGYGHFVARLIIPYDSNMLTSKYSPETHPAHPLEPFVPVLKKPFHNLAQNEGFGFTLIELLVVMAILGTLAAIAVPLFASYTERARVARAGQEIRVLQGEISAYEAEKGTLPLSLEEIHRDQLRDPWGNPYQYQSLDNVPKGKWRKDKFLVPINSTYDLWSMGPDGKTAIPLTAKASQDDIIRANDGNFIGRAVAY